jgi:hypothetical protein
MDRLVPELSLQESHTWAQLSACSPGVALTLIENKADALYRELLELITTSPGTQKLHTFAERFARKDADAQWHILSRLFLWLLSRIIAHGASISAEVFPGEQQALLRLHNAKPLDNWTELWEKAGKLLSDADRLHLDKKQAILTLLRAIGE